MQSIHAYIHLSARSIKHAAITKIIDDVRASLFIDIEGKHACKHAKMFTMEKNFWSDS